MTDSASHDAQTRLLHLQDRIVESMSVADSLQLAMVALHLDSARCELVGEMERHQLHGDVIDVSTLER